MMAAYSASFNNEVILLEKNEKLGKKIFITGKGRGNFTNSSKMDEHLKNVVSNPRFLYSAYNCFDNEDLMNLLKEAGMEYKIERGNRVFPETDHAYEITDALKRLLKKNRVDIRLNSEVKDIIVEDDIFKGVIINNNEKIYGDALIMATGGLSYSSTGSTGDGYKFAKKLGHTVTDLRPALVAMKVKEKWVKDLKGLDLKNVSISIYKDKKVIYKDFGEMGFNEDGVDGPIIISASSYCGKYLPLKMYIDLKPALDKDTLDKRILREFNENLNKKIKDVIGKLLPIKLGMVVLEISEIDEDILIHDVTSVQRKRLLDNIKNLEMNLIELKSFDEAIITQGGISVKEIDPKTMESKKIKGLYFAGEIIDVDALTGGFNMQIAFSTGYLAGKSV